MIRPFVERGVFNGMSYGLSAAGYDVRLDQGITIHPEGFVLASTLEHLDIPTDLLVTVHDKSSWARRGIACQTTVFEPGWRGFATLELSNHGYESIEIPSGAPIAQLLFHRLVEPTEQPYSGKYQDQGRGPQPAKEES